MLFNFQFCIILLSASRRSLMVKHETHKLKTVVRFHASAQNFAENSKICYICLVKMRA